MFNFVTMDKRSSSFINRSAWVLVALMLGVPVETRVEEEAPREPPPHTTTVPPEPIEQHLNLGKCLHLTRDYCPAPGDGCRTLGEGALFCCDIDPVYYRDVLSQNLTHKTRYLHVLNGTIGELDLSKASYKRLVSMAFTDGRIGQIVGQVPRHASMACLNISHNELTNKTLFTNRPFAHLYNLTVLDASANNLTDILLPVQSNKKISIDLSGNKNLPCKSFQEVMEKNASQVTFLNYNDTYCALGLSFNWFKDVQIVKIDYLRVQKELNASCHNIKPLGINCTCVADVVEVNTGGVTRLVAVDCSARNLTEMPTDLPPSTVELDVSHNNITSLQPVADDPTYDHLRRLKVDHNDITNILGLEGTKFMETFMLFSITHNKLKTIHTYVLSSRFDTVGPGFMVAWNYIQCDCNTEKMLKPWLLENAKNIPDYRYLLCQGMGAVVDLVESQVCHTPRDWTDYIYYIIALEVLILVLLVSKVSYDYWVFKTAGYLPWPANKMPRLPCDWLCE